MPDDAAQFQPACRAASAAASRRLRQLCRCLGRRLLVVAFGLGLAACSESPLPKQTIILETGSEWLAQHLQQQRIGFEQSGTVFELADPLPPSVTDYLQQQLDTALPQGRSMVLSPQIRAEVHAEMENQGIDYHTLMFNGREWLVWDQPDDTERVKHILSAVVSEQLDC